MAIHMSDNKIILEKKAIHNGGRPFFLNIVLKFLKCRKGVKQAIIILFRKFLNHK